MCVGDVGVCAKRAGTRTFSNEISFVECSDYKMIFANHEMMSDHGAFFCCCWGFYFVVYPRTYYSINFFHNFL